VYRISWCSLLEIDCSWRAGAAWSFTGPSIVVSGEQANYRTSGRWQVEIREEPRRTGDYNKSSED